MEKVIVFDIWGDYAHFKKIETTTSPLTYSIPTGTALSGLTASVLGYARDSYYNIFSRENIKFAIKLLNSVKKSRINQNLINTSSGFYLWDCGPNPRTQIPYEYVKDPKYRIYVSVDDEDIYNNLKRRIKAHKTFYTIYLGISEHIANFKFIGEFDLIKIRKENVEIDSVLSKNKTDINLSNIKEGMKLIVETIPMYMNEERIVKEYAEVIFDSNGNTIPLEETEYFKIGEDNVIFL